MNIEKRATNKVGLIIFITVVLVGLIVGGFFLIKHKDKLNIDWNFTLPWNKKSEEEIKDNPNGAASTSKKGKNQNTTFKVPDIIQTPEVNHTKSCYFYFDDLDSNDKDVIINYHVLGRKRSNIRVEDNGCIVKLKRYVVDGFEISGSTEIEVGPGETKNGQIKLAKADLESQELVGMNELQIYIEDIDTDTKASNEFVASIAFRSNRIVKNEKSGIPIDELNKTSLQYYKTTTDAVNTYIYFIADNHSEYAANIKVRKLIVNDKLVDTKDFDLTVGSKAKRLFYIAVPKTKFSNVKKFTISFFDLTTDAHGEQYFLISNEYSRKY